MEGIPFYVLCQAFSDSVLAHDRVHSNNSAERVACSSASVFPFHCGHAPQAWLCGVPGAASARCSLLGCSALSQMSGEVAQRNGALSVSWTQK